MSKPRKRFEVFQGQFGNETMLPVDWVIGHWYWRLKAGNSKIQAIGGESFVSVGNAVKAAQRMNAMLAERLPIEVLS
jgi:hypothetical protein